MTGGMDERERDVVWRWFRLEGELTRLAWVWEMSVIRVEANPRPLYPVALIGSNRSGPGRCLGLARIAV